MRIERFSTCLAQCWLMVHVSKSCHQHHYYLHHFRLHAVSSMGEEGISRLGTSSDLQLVCKIRK